MLYSSSLRRTPRTATPTASVSNSSNIPSSGGPRVRVSKHIGAGRSQHTPRSVGRTRKPQSLFESRMESGSGAAQGVAGSDLDAAPILHEGPRHSVRSYQPLPTSLLSLAKKIDSSSAISCRLFSNIKMALAVCDQLQQVLIWNCVQSVDRPSSLSFTIPEDCNSASLVALLPSKRNTSLLAVGRRGHVRYWPQMAVGTAIMETSVDLPENVYLTRLEPYSPFGALVGASDGSLYMIKINVSNRTNNSYMMGAGADVLQVRPITERVGVLGRLWSRIQGTVANGAVQKILPTFISQKDTNGVVFVVTNNILEMWQINSNEDMLCCRYTIDQLVSEMNSVDSKEEVYRGREKRLVDLCTQNQGGQDEVFALISYTSVDGKSTKFCIVRLLVENTRIKIAVGSVANLPFSAPNREGGDVSGAHLLLPHYGNGCYVHWPSLVVFSCLPRDERPSNTMQLVSPDERILSAGRLYHHDAILVITLRYGVIALTQPDLPDMSGIQGSAQLQAAAALTPVVSTEPEVDENTAGSAEKNGAAAMAVDHASQPGRISSTPGTTFATMPSSVRKTPKDFASGATLTPGGKSTQRVLSSRLGLEDTNALEMKSGLLMVPNAVSQSDSAEQWSGVLNQMFAAFLDGQELQPLPEDWEGGGVGCEQAVLRCSARILDAKAAPDDRWAEENGSFLRSQRKVRTPGGQEEVGMAKSLVLRHELAAKFQRHRQFVKFLNLLSIWPRLSPVGRANLIAHGQLSASALALRTHQDNLEREGRHEGQQLLYAAMFRLEERVLGEDANSHAFAKKYVGVNQDVVRAVNAYYTRITGCAAILPVLQALTVQPVETSTLENSSLQHVAHAQRLVDCNDVFMCMAEAGTEYRRRMQREQHDGSLVYAIRGWLMTPAIRQAWQKQIRATAEFLRRIEAQQGKGASSGNDYPSLAAAAGAVSESALAGSSSFGNSSMVNPLHDRLYDQIVQLSCALLESFSDQVDDPSLTNLITQRQQAHVLYENVCSSVLSNFLRGSGERLARAGMAVAERHQQFGILIQLCDQLGLSSAQGQKYREKYTQYGAHLMQHQLDSGRLADLLRDGEQSSQASIELAKFLEERDSLSWIHGLHSGNYQGAVGALVREVSAEKQSLQRVHTLLSVAKLSALAAVGSGQEENLATFSASGESIDARLLIEQRLYALRCQRCIHGKGTSLVQDAVSEQPTLPFAADKGDKKKTLLDQDEEPMSTIEIVKELGHRSTLESILLAFDLLEHTELLRTIKDSKAAQSWLWQQALGANDWALLARDLALTAVDTAIESSIQETIYYRVSATRPALAKEYLHATLNHYIQSHTQTDSASQAQLVRVLETVKLMIQNLP